MILLDKNDRQIREGDRVRMVGEVKMVSTAAVQVKWEAEGDATVVGYVLQPETLEIVDEE